jgi:hypothetical protein
MANNIINYKLIVFYYVLQCLFDQKKKITFPNDVGILYTRSIVCSTSAVRIFKIR